MDNTRPSNKLAFTILGIILVVHAIIQILITVNNIEFYKNILNSFYTVELEVLLFAGSLIFSVIFIVLELITGILALIFVDNLRKQKSCIVLTIIMIIIVYLETFLQFSYYYYGQEILSTIDNPVLFLVRVFYEAITCSFILILFLIISIQNRRHWKKNTPIEERIKQKYKKYPQMQNLGQYYEQPNQGQQYQGQPNAYSAQNISNGQPQQGQPPYGQNIPQGPPQQGQPQQGQNTSQEQSSKE